MFNLHCTLALSYTLHYILVLSYILLDFFAQSVELAEFNLSALCILKSVWQIKILNLTSFKIVEKLKIIVICLNNALYLQEGSQNSIRPLQHNPLWGCLYNNMGSTDTEQTKRWKWTQLITQGGEEGKKWMKI